MTTPYIVRTRSTRGDLAPAAIAIKSKIPDTSLWPDITKSCSSIGNVKYTRFFRVIESNPEILFIRFL